MKFKIGDKVLINKVDTDRYSGFDLKGLIGKVARVSWNFERNIGVKFENITNQNSGAGLFWFVPDELNKVEEYDYTVLNNDYVLPNLSDKNQNVGGMPLTEFNTEKSVSTLSTNGKIGGNVMDNKMEKLIELWYEKQEQNINNEYDKRTQELKDSDPRRQELCKAIESLNSVILSYVKNARYKVEYRKDPLTMDKILFIKGLEGGDFLTDSTLNEVASMNSEKEEELEKLSATREIVSAMVEACETYDQKMNVLRRYGVVDKNGKLVA